jgi:hypothetical protein
MDPNPYEAPLEPAEQTVFRDASPWERLFLPVARQLVRALYGVVPVLLFILAYVVLLVLWRVWE